MAILPETILATRMFGTKQGFDFRLRPRRRPVREDHQDRICDAFGSARNSARLRMSSSSPVTKQTEVWRAPAALVAAGFSARRDPVSQLGSE
jgi:hypothetical protein